MTFPANTFRVPTTGLSVKKVSTHTRPSPHFDRAAAMEVGDTWQTEGDSRNPCSCAINYGKRHGKKFTSKRNGNGWLITRVK